MQRAIWVVTVAVCLFLGAAGGVLLLAKEQQAQPAPAAQRDMKDKAFLGVQWIQQDDGSLLITSVHPGSPAYMAGLIRDDRIIGLEGLKDGKPEPFPTVATGVMLQLGLVTAAPGAEFKLRVRRGRASLDVERLVCVDLPREGLTVPACEHVFDHYRRVAKDWQQAPEVWISVKSGSYAEFAAFHAKEQQIEIARLEIARIQKELENMDAERELIQAEIARAIEQKNLARAQQELTRLNKVKTALQIVRVGLQIMFMLFL